MSTIPPIYSSFEPIGVIGDPDVGERHLAIVTYQGHRQLLYRSSGHGSTMLTEGRWCPCDGILCQNFIGFLTPYGKRRLREREDQLVYTAPHVIKHRYTMGFSHTAPLYKLGSADALALSNNIREIEAAGELPTSDHTFPATIRGGIAVNTICRERNVEIMTGDQIGEDLVGHGMIDSYILNKSAAYNPNLFEKIRDTLYGY